MEEEKELTRSGFLIRNLAKGLIWFVIILTVFLVTKEYLYQHFEHRIQATTERPLLLYSLFFLSEVIFGLIPPEFFMLAWILNKVRLGDFVTNLGVLTCLSYLAGVLGYHIGRHFSKTSFVRQVQERYLEKYSRQVKRFGGFAVFVGAVTPVPFSATCMLAGSIEYPYAQFLLISLFRVLRFLLYGWLLWSFPGLLT